jgi:hypothetical protein
MRKIYRSIVYKDLSTYVMVNGQKTLVQFKGGSLQPPVNGTYVTDDPDMIRALDKDNGNGKTFRCIHSEGEPLPEEKPQVTVKVEAATMKVKPEAIPTIEKEAKEKEVPGIKTLQQAKEYLLKNIEGLSPSQMPNAASVKNQAAKHGIKFIDLK